MLAAKEEAIIEGNPAAVECQEIQQQPSPVRRNFRHSLVKFTHLGTAAYRRALVPLPGRCFDAQPVFQGCLQLIAGTHDLVSHQPDTVQPLESPPEVGPSLGAERLEVAVPGAGQSQIGNVAGMPQPGEEPILRCQLWDLLQSPGARRKLTEPDGVPQVSLPDDRAPDLAVGFRRVARHDEIKALCIFVVYEFQETDIQPVNALLA